MKAIMFAAALAASLAGYSGVAFERAELWPGFDGKWCKIQPSVASDGGNVAMMTYQHLLLTGIDVFSGQYVSRSGDGGRTWSEPVLIPESKDVRERGLRVARYVNVHYSRVNRKWFATGIATMYDNDAKPFQKYVDGKPYGYSVQADVDAASGAVTNFRPLDFPIPYKFAVRFGQFVECDNGDFLMPFYFGPVGPEKSRAVVVRYRFGKNGLEPVEAGTPVADDARARGICEPSLVKFRGKYYLTLRSDECGLFAESDDGLHFGKPVAWAWADGQPIGNANTQQHWVPLGDKLYLAYTRVTPTNGHVFRNRAPVFIAEFDAEKRCLKRETEQAVVPERGARLGNFVVAPGRGDETWLVTAEWMQPLGCGKYGSDNAVWFVRFQSGEARVDLKAPVAGSRKVETIDPKGANRITMRVEVPARDVQEMWMPSWLVPRQERKWWLNATSAPQCDMPYVAYFNAAGRNAFSIGAAALEWDVKIDSRINQEKGVWEVALTVAAGPEGRLRPFAVTLDRRAVDWTDALDDWRKSLKTPAGVYPDGAWKPVYCSWYARHAAVTQDWVERTAKIASELGFKTFILDDGWSYDEAKRVNPETIKTWYRDTGRWDAFSKVKFPDFKAHRERMRALGLNYVVWVSPYFVGTRSEAFTKYGFDKRGDKPFEGNVLADPADRALMDSVDDQLVRLMKDADLDGLKIDFLDYVLPSVENPRGAASLAYVEKLMSKLRAVKPNGLFEFRQNYATPITAHLATQFRAGDVPFEWLPNLLGVAQIRVTMGDGVPIHSDPIYWSEQETDANVDRHFMAAMAGVPMLSMDLEKMPAARRERVRAWMRFYSDRVEKFQRRGHWNVRYHNGGLATATAVLGDEALLIVNDAAQLKKALADVGARRLVVLNLSDETLAFPSFRVAPAASYPALAVPAAKERP